MTKDNNFDTNGWSRAELYVMEELRQAKEDRIRMTEKLDALDGKITELRVDVARKGALWGAISGTVVAVVGLLVKR